ncbi:MAG: hypothetical protein V4491_04705 [Pseudomonadota bacterium]
MLFGVPWPDALIAIVTFLSAPAVALGVWQARSALRSQNLSGDMQTVLTLWERLDHHWCRFLEASNDRGKAFEFGQLSGYYELACGLFRDQVLTTSATRTLREHLAEILPKMQANAEFASRFDALRSEPSTFENIAWFCEHITGPEYKDVGPMNRRRGLTRLAIAYFGVWAVIGLLGYMTQRDGAKQFLLVSRADPNFQSSAELAVWNDQMQFGANLIEAAILMGIIVPVAAAIVGAIGWWIYRGFSPKIRFR